MKSLETTPNEAPSEGPGQRAPEAPLSIHLALLIVQVAFGSLAVEGKIAMSDGYNVSPEALAMMRILGGALVFVPANLLISNGGEPVRKMRDAVGLALLSIFGIALNQALFLRGLSQTSPVSATLLVATIPIFTTVIAVIAGRDKLSARSGLGFLLAVFGIVVLSGFSVPRRGDLFVLLNSASYAAYVVFSKGALGRHGTLSVMAWVFGAAAVLFSPIGGAALLRDAPRWSASAIGLVAFVVLVPTVFAYGVNAWALRRASPTLVTIYIYLQPLVVVLLSAVQLGQAPTLGAVIGGLLILAGVAVVASRKTEASAATAKEGDAG